MKKLNNINKNHVRCRLFLESDELSVVLQDEVAGTPVPDVFAWKRTIFVFLIRKRQKLQLKNNVFVFLIRKCQKLTKN